MKPKQVIVVRKDLSMRKGKIAAQAAHASMKVLLDIMNWETQDIDGRYTKKSILNIIPDSALDYWLEEGFAKICVYVESEEELLELYEKAKAEGILCSLITDSGRTEFHGVPTNTCIAIGPDWPEKIDPITGNLKLL